jgi:hypothetical protein
MKKIFFLLTISALLSCNRPDLPEYDELEGLRILGLIASSPEVDAGGTTTITPILSDINETTALTYEALACISITGVDTSCDNNPTTVNLQNGTLNSGDMTAARGFTGSADPIAVVVPSSAIIFSQRSAQDQFNGITYLFTYAIHNSRGDTVQSFRRIVVSTRNASEKDLNPVLNDITADGMTLTATLPAGQSLSVRPSFGSPSTQSYRVQTDSGDFRTESEELVTTWFSNDGDLKYTRSVADDANTFEAPSALPTNHDLYLIAVTRDGRGGLAWKKKCFGICP